MTRLLEFKWQCAVCWKAGNFKPRDQRVQSLIAGINRQHDKVSPDCAGDLVFINIPTIRRPAKRPP
jgi:hypothetical protein